MRTTKAQIGLGIQAVWLLVISAFVIRFLYSIIHVLTVAVSIILACFCSWAGGRWVCLHSPKSGFLMMRPSLIRVFAVRMKKAWVLSYPLSAQWRLWSDWADAQANLSLRWAHSHFVGFVMRRLMWCFIKGLLSHFKLAIHVHVQLYFSIKSWLYT